MEKEKGKDSDGLKPCPCSGMKCPCGCGMKYAGVCRRPQPCSLCIEDYRRMMNIESSKITSVNESNK